MIWFSTATINAQLNVYLLKMQKSKFLLYFSRYNEYVYSHRPSEGSIKYQLITET